MLLARVEQTDEKLIITPMKYIGWDTLVAVSWMIVYLGVCMLAGLHIRVYSVLLKSPEIYEVMSLATVPVGVLIALIRSKTRHALWQWPGRAFVFERSTPPEGRVAMQVRNQGEGSSALRLMFILPGPAGPDERNILETTVFSFARMFSHNPFDEARWETYPDDRLPDNATEYELVMLANLIHDYLGLQEPAPCKHLIPFPTATPNKTY